MPYACITCQKQYEGSLPPGQASKRQDRFAPICPEGHVMKDKLLGSTILRSFGSSFGRGALMAVVLLLVGGLWISIVNGFSEARVFAIPIGLITLLIISVCSISLLIKASKWQRSPSLAKLAACAQARAYGMISVLILAGIFAILRM